MAHKLLAIRGKHKKCLRRQVGAHWEPEVDTGGKVQIGEFNGCSAHIVQLYELQLFGGDIAGCQRVIHQLGDTQRLNRVRRWRPGNKLNWG